MQENVRLQLVLRENGEERTHDLHSGGISKWLDLLRCVRLLHISSWLCPSDITTRRHLLEI